MKSMTKIFAVAALTVAFVGASMQLTTTSAEAGPKSSVGSKSFAGQTSGSSKKSASGR